LPAMRMTASLTRETLLAPPAAGAPVTVSLMEPCIKVNFHASWVWRLEWIFQPDTIAVIQYATFTNRVKF
jgi:hypothetical protein